MLIPDFFAFPSLSEILKIKKRGYKASVQVSWASKPEFHYWFKLREKRVVFYCSGSLIQNITTNFNNIGEKYLAFLCNFSPLENNVLTELW